MRIDVTPALREALSEADLPDGGAVFEATSQVASWREAREVLLGAFRISQGAARAEAPIVYVVHGHDLLGRRGAASAVMATGLLSAARTAALELSRKGAPVNVVAVDDDTSPSVVARWVTRLTERDGPTGELVHLHPDHMGKALP
ncbi:MAG: hypothetical protein ACLFWM_03510 [Actinomycetota bacterium]